MRCEHQNADSHDETCRSSADPVKALVVVVILSRL